MIKDVLASKLKAFGYKFLFGFIAGPVIRLIGLPIYIFSYGIYMRKYAITIIQIGSPITRDEFEVVNNSFTACIFSCFFSSLGSDRR